MTHITKSAIPQTSKPRIQHSAPLMERIATPLLFLMPLSKSGKKGRNWLLEIYAKNSTPNRLSRLQKRRLARLLGYKPYQLTFGAKVTETLTGHEVCPFHTRPIVQRHTGNGTVEITRYEKNSLIPVSRSTSYKN